MSAVLLAASNGVNRWAADNWVGLGLAILGVAYLVVVLVKPERF